MSEVVLRTNHVRPILYGHPWVYPGAILSSDGAARGARVGVRSESGQALGEGCYNPDSHLRVRMWRGADEHGSDAELLRRRLLRALRLRQALGLTGKEMAYRWIFGAADGLDGLVIDVYSDVLVVHVGSLLMDSMRTLLWDELRAVFSVRPVRAIVERSDAQEREREGLSPSGGVVWGEVPEALHVVEAEVAYEVDVLAGQKTGLYLDQRDNRAFVREHAAGKSVLDVCCYTGGFALSALRGGALSAVAVDRSKHAIAAALRNAARNGLTLDCRVGEMAESVRAFADAGDRFDLVVLDPPGLTSRREHVTKASRLMHELVTGAMALVEDGLLIVFSCTTHLGAQDLALVIREAAFAARKSALFVRELGQALDHPVSAAFPEGKYLSGFAVSVHDR